MRFYMQTGNTRDMGKKTGVEGVESIRIDTGSLVPRTNRKWIRKVLVEALGVKPCFVKYVMKTMNFWTADELGVACPKKRHEMYREVIAYAKNQQSGTA